MKSLQDLDIFVRTVDSGSLSATARSDFTEHSQCPTQSPHTRHPSGRQSHPE